MARDPESLTTTTLPSCRAATGGTRGAPPSPSRRCRGHYSEHQAVRGEHNRGSTDVPLGRCGRWKWDCVTAHVGSNDLWDTATDRQGLPAERDCCRHQARASGRCAPVTPFGAQEPCASSLDHCRDPTPSGWRYRGSVRRLVAGHVSLTSAWVRRSRGASSCPLSRYRKITICALAFLDCCWPRSYPFSRAGGWSSCHCSSCSRSAGC